MERQEAWQPPTKEIRSIRREFYGPLTDAILRSALEGEEETAASVATAERVTATRRGFKKEESFDPDAAKWFVDFPRREVVPISSRPFIDQVRREIYFTFRHSKN